MKLTLLIGGVRAGKSAKALALATDAEKKNPGKLVLFAATAQAFDNEMSARITAHRQERPAHWITLESPIALVSDIERVIGERPEISTVVIDCLTLWTSNIMLALPDEHDAEQVASERAHELVGMIQQNGTTQFGSSQSLSRDDVVGLRTIEHTDGSTALPLPNNSSAAREWIVVTNEVGLGIVPPTVMGRQYRDALGRVNQIFANAASAVLLMVAGLEIPIK